MRFQAEPGTEETIVSDKNRTAELVSSGTHESMPSLLLKTNREYMCACMVQGNAALRYFPTKKFLRGRGRFFQEEPPYSLDLLLLLFKRPLFLSLGFPKEAQ